MRSTCLLFISHLVYGILLQHPKLIMMIAFHKVDINIEMVMLSHFPRKKYKIKYMWVCGHILLADQYITLFFLCVFST